MKKNLGNFFRPRHQNFLVVLEIMLQDFFWLRSCAIKKFMKKNLINFFRFRHQNFPTALEIMLQEFFYYKLVL
jgi:hypothetical protein